jgi:DNA invertase Pin-like site-specific DNA recombinase
LASIEASVLAPILFLSHFHRGLKAVDIETQRSVDLAELKVRLHSDKLVIDPSRWQEVVERIEEGESLRQVARVYQVSHETIRRVLVMVQESGEKNGSRNRHTREKEVISVPLLG